MAAATAGSSSTTRTRPLRPGDDAGGVAAIAGDAAGARGSATRTVVPPPGRLSTTISPPSARTMPWQIESPSPVPTPWGFVVKNGSKIRSRDLGRDPAAGVAHLDERRARGDRSP